jgi:amino acid transporter
MKNPTWTDFLYRVGGAAAIYLVVIELTKMYAPAYVGISVLLVTLAIFVFVAIRGPKSRKKSKGVRK